MEKVVGNLERQGKRRARSGAEKRSIQIEV